MGGGTLVKTDTDHRTQAEGPLRIVISELRHVGYQWNTRDLNMWIRQVKLSLYRPGQALRVRGWLRLPTIPDSRRTNAVRLSALCTGRLYIGRRYPQNSFLWRWVDSRAIVRPEGSIQWKIPISPSGIEPAAFPLVAECLNWATACPIRIWRMSYLLHGVESLRS